LSQASQGVSELGPAASNAEGGTRTENSDGECLLVSIGVKQDGSKERVAIADGYRESKDSWRDLLLDLRARGPRGDCFTR
jgi:putative transposase